MPGESISFDITASGDADRKFRQTGDAALYASGKIDIAAASVKAFDDASAKMGKAAASSQKAFKAHADATKLLADAENVLAGKATVTTRLLADQQQKLKGSGDEAAKTASRFAGLAGTGGGAAGVTGMGALIGAGVVLSPILATLGTGLGGLGLAAYGIAKPIENAAQKTGGLQKNLHLLNPEQQVVARGLLSLGQTFGGFERQLQPVVLTDFSDGLRLAGSLLHDIEPVAQATGQALGGFLSQIDKQFQSGTWQQFFNFMAKSAGPDMRLLGQAFSALLNDIPPLLTDLQPLARDFLELTTGALKLFGGLEKVHLALPLVGAAIGATLAGPLGAAAGAALGAGVELNNLADKAPVVVNNIGKAGTALERTAATSGRFGSSLGVASGNAVAATKATKSLADAAAKVPNPAQAAATELAAMARSVNAVTAAESKSLNTLLTYSGLILTSANDAHALEQALKKSHDQIGLHTAAQRASFGAANTYITDLAKQASGAIAAGKGEDGAISAIRNGLPILDAAKTKNRLYWQEVKTLHDWLVKLENLKAIHETVYVSGSGTFTVRPGTKLGLPGGTAGGPFATGGMVPGSGNGDTVSAMLTPGEAVVPKRLVGAVAPILRAGKVPGFASGGLVPSYSGSVAGLAPWSRHDLNATVSIFEQTMAKATLAGIRSAAQSASSFGGRTSAGGQYNLGSLESLWDRVGGPGGYTAHVAGAIALAESGGNPNAYNPSGASGLWQILGQVYPGNIFNPVINAINAVTKYQAAGGFSPWVTYESGAYLQYMDRGGFLRPGINHVFNGTGRPEMVVPNTGGGKQEIVLRIEGGSDQDLVAALVHALRKKIRTSTGGNVQLALGRS